MLVDVPGHGRHRVQEMLWDVVVKAILLLCGIGLVVCQKVTATLL